MRANVPDSFSHFFFDGAVLGLYLAIYTSPSRSYRSPAARPMRKWVLVLIGWAVFMCLLPVQNYLIQLVGLRGNGFYLPFLLVGACLGRKEAGRLAYWLAGLNVLALGFALGEYVLGLPAFFPRNPVTEIMYSSGDVAGGTAFRIPGPFANAHSYGLAMVATIPWLVGSLLQPGTQRWQQGFLFFGLLAAMLGTFLCAARQPVVGLMLLVVLITFSGKIPVILRIGWVAILIVGGLVVSNEERLQRFTTLADTDMVHNRLAGSINVSFLELLTTYPMGNGMGAGGTSIPFFLQGLIRNRVGMENDFSRILLEQGLVGLILWLAFLLWVLLHRPAANRKDPWVLCRRLLWALGLLTFASGVIGIGILVVVPQSILVFLGVGFATTQPLISKKRSGAVKESPPSPQLARMERSVLPAPSPRNGAEPLGLQPSAEKSESSGDR